MITLLNIMEAWMISDEVLLKHFGIKINRHWPQIYFHCGNYRSHATFKRYIAQANMLVPNELLLATINDDNIRTEYGQLNATCPLFFNRIKAHLFNMHNISKLSCDEHLCQR